MEFENLRDSIQALLLANQSTHFRTIVSQKQSKTADEVKGTLRTVQVFFQEGDAEKYDKTQFEHDMTFGLYLTVAEPATADKATLDDPNATAAQKQAALLMSMPGSDKADRSMDELYRMVILILKDPVNEDLGLAKYIVSNPRIRNFRKDQPVDHGNLILLTASARLTATVIEIMIGGQATAAVQPAIGVETQFTPANGDPTAATASEIGANIDTDP